MAFELPHFKYQFFLTLTYDAEHLPTESPVVIDGESFNFVDRSGLLLKSDLQKYLKRLRKATKDNIVALRYFAAGEYGHSNFYTNSRGMECVGTNRPHFHLLVWFNTINNDHDFTDQFKRSAFESWHSSSSAAYYCEPVRSQDAVSNYCAKYIMKAASLNDLDEYAELAKCHYFPMFRCMSEKIGYAVAEDIGWQALNFKYSDIRGDHYIPKALKDHVFFRRASSYEAATCDSDLNRFLSGLRKKCRLLTDVVSKESPFGSQIHRDSAAQNLENEKVKIAVHDLLSPV